MSDFRRRVLSAECRVISGRGGEWESGRVGEWLLRKEFAVGDEFGLGCGILELFGNHAVLAEALDYEC